MKGFYQQVYEIVAQIPRGKVCSYGEIAKLLGNPRGARMVGWAMGAVPEGLDIPCHRVVYQEGSLSPDHVFAGNQRRLLEEEGVTFTATGKVRMDRHLWP